MDYQKAYDTISKIMWDTGWSPDSQLVLETSKEVSSLVHAANLVEHWQLEVSLDKNIEEKIKELNKKHGLGIKDPLDRILYATSKHELGHWEISPRTPDMFRKIMESVTTGLERGASFGDDELKTAAPHLENMFTDTIDNCAQTLDPRYMEGLALLHSTRGLHGMGKDDKADFGELYGVFADPQLKFGGVTEAQRTLIEKTLPNYKELEQVSKDVLAVFIGKEMAEKAFAGTLTKEEKVTAIEEMRDEWKWGSKAREYASIMAPIVKKHINDLKEMDLHGFADQWDKDPNFRKKIIKRSIEEHNQIPKFADGFEAFDAAYRKAANEIVVEFAKAKQAAEPPKIPLFYMGMKRVDLQGAVINPSNIAYSKTRVYGGTMSFARKSNPFTITKDDKKRDATSDQDILFMLDTSGSMRWTNVPLDGSRFDVCIRTYFAVLKFLEDEKKLEFLDYGFARFGDPGETIFYGWKDWRNIDEVSRSIHAVKTDSGDTQVDKGVLDRIAEEHAKLRPNRSFVMISVSDGGISNSDEALQDYIGLMKAGNDIVHFAVGSSEERLDPFALALRTAGAIVVPIEDPEKMIGITLDLVRKRYSRKRDAAGESPTPSAPEPVTSATGSSGRRPRPMKSVP
jgi:hypothetical protein